MVTFPVMVCGACNGPAAGPERQSGSAHLMLGSGQRNEVANHERTQNLQDNKSGARKTNLRMPGSLDRLEVPGIRRKLAASDGELSSSDTDGRGSSHSLTSLSTTRSQRSSRERTVSSWAVSFEHLLQDPLGVTYFTEFLKKEFSAENIFFWDACERFQHIPAEDSIQLQQESRRIYDEHLSSDCISPVNIDRQAWVAEDLLEKPTPNMFQVPQMQIFNLMKFDSYARFVRSPLYQECMLAEVEGRSLPDLSPTPSSSKSRSSNPSSEVQKKRLKAGKSLPIGVEVAGADNLVYSFSEKVKRRSFKKKDPKESGGELTDGESVTSLRRRSHGSLNSAASLDPGFLASLSTKSGHTAGNVSSSEAEMKTRPESGPVKYCCVYLPDGTASLTAVRQGLSIREMLSGICQKRGLCIFDVRLYLTGSKQKALVLDQESTVLTDQEVTLDNRISFELEIPIIQKVVRISAKSTKTVREALQPIAEKYGVSPQQVTLHLCGESDALDLNRPVTSVAGNRLVLGMIPEVAASVSKEIEKDEAQTKHKDGCTSGVASKALDEGSFAVSHVTRHREDLPVKNPLNRRTYDIEGLVELLNRVQRTRVEDQRGLLSKEDLILPDFLQLPSSNKDDPMVPEQTASDPDCCRDHHEASVLNPDSQSEGLGASTANKTCDLQDSGSHLNNPDCNPESCRLQMTSLHLNGKCSRQEVANHGQDTLPTWRETPELNNDPAHPGQQEAETCSHCLISGTTVKDLLCSVEFSGSTVTDSEKRQSTEAEGSTLKVTLVNADPCHESIQQSQLQSSQDPDRSSQPEGCPLNTNSPNLQHL